MYMFEDYKGRRKMYVFILGVGVVEWPSIIPNNTRDENYKKKKKTLKYFLPFILVSRKIIKNI